jgi:hypothetical protein
MGEAMNLTPLPACREGLGVGARVCAPKRLITEHRSTSRGIEPRPALTHPLPLPFREGSILGTTPFFRAPTVTGSSAVTSLPLGGGHSPFDRPPIFRLAQFAIE